MDDWIRAPQSRRLMWAALVLSLVLGVILVVVDRQEADAGEVRVPLTDEQAVEQVVDSAREIVAAARLRDAAGGYSFVPCEAENGPPYQAALYMSFTLPQSDWARYLDEIASVMTAEGWTDHPPKPSISAANSSVAASRPCYNVTSTTRPMPPCVSTASVGTPPTIETTTQRGRKSVCEAALQ